MAENILFRNARLIFPDRIEPRGDLRVVDGRIAALAPALSPEQGDAVVDLEGRYLAPGFIDIHIHGALGADAMDATQEAFRKICAYHASGGTTSLALTTVTAALPEIVKVLAAAREYRRNPLSGGEWGAQLLGLHIEGPYFSKEKKGAHDASLIVNPTPEHYKTLLEWESEIVQMTLAPELPGALGLIDALRARGIRVSGGHSDAWDEEACAAFAHGMEGVTHTFNCMSGARRRGPYRVAGLLEFALSEPGIVCELIADGRHVSPTLIRMLYFAKGPDGICLVTDASAGAGLAEEAPFLLGEIECVVRDRVGLTADGSALAGSTSSMIRLVQVMVEEAQVSLAEAVRMATLNPARALKLDGKGVLDRGAAADLVVFNDRFEVEATYVAGKAVFER